MKKLFAFLLSIPLLTGCTIVSDEYFERRELIVTEITRELNDPDIDRVVVDKVLKAAEKRILKATGGQE